MKVNSFEKAIEALGGNIELTEVKIHKGQVRRFYGHKEDMNIMWDGTGKGYTSSRDKGERACEASDSVYHRNEKYDLIFV